MTIESATHVSDLNASYPAAGDAKSEGDDHIRLIKTVVKTDVSTLSASASTTLSTVTAVSTVAANVSTSLGNVSTSLGNVSTSLGNVSTSLGNVSTSNANVSTSLSTNTSTLTAVSSTVATISTGAMTFVSSQTASASSYIEFTGFASGYDYVVEGDGIYFASADTLNLRLTNGGTPDSGSVYSWSGLETSSAGGSPYMYSGTLAAAYVTVNQLSNSSTARGRVRVHISNPSATTNARIVTVEISTFTGGNVENERTVIAYRSTSAVDGIRLYPNGTTITAGTFNLYKIARS